jgi:hypothetical protein
MAAGFGRRDCDRRDLHAWFRLAVTVLIAVFARTSRWQIDEIQVGQELLFMKPDHVKFFCLSEYLEFTYLYYLGLGCGGDARICRGSLESQAG